MRSILQVVYSFRTVDKLTNLFQSMMPTFKLIYFNARARAEPVRFMFHLAGVEYEDVRLPFNQWRDYKERTPLGQLPVLEVDGKQLPQSVAVCRYVARKFGFYPTDDWDQALVDVVSETVVDLVVLMSTANGEKDPGRKAELTKLLRTTKSKRHLANLEKLLGQNKEGKGWFVGDEITFADIHVFCLIHDQYPATVLGEKAGDVDYLKEYKLLHGFVARFKAEPNVSDWLAKRPVTPF